MMAIMQDRNSEEVPREFLETGRTGRRNAMPDILHPQGAEVSTADLPSRLQQLVTTGNFVVMFCFFNLGNATGREAEFLVTL